MNVAVSNFDASDILILNAGIDTAAKHFENISHEMFAEVRVAGNERPSAHPEIG